MKFRNLLSFGVVLLLLSATAVRAQTVFWTADFNAGHGWLLNTSTGANSASCNLWYVSCRDDGLPAGGCGSDCVTGDPSLHVGSQTLGDVGAAYDASQQTNRRAESPNINTIAAGMNTITLRFNAIHFGEGATDRCQLLYSTDGGTTWGFIVNPIPKAGCCGGACNGQRQGLWTAFSYALPVACNNITNLRIAFNWINNAAGGTDPSFGVDDVTLEYNAPMPVSWLSFTGKKTDGAVQLNWKTASEINNEYFEIQRSFDGLAYDAIGKIKGAGNSNSVINYTYDDRDIKSGVAYYRLKQVDFNGKFEYSQIIAVNHDGATGDIILVHTNVVGLTFDASVYTMQEGDYRIRITDVSGRELYARTYAYVRGENSFHYSTAGLARGVYFFHVKSNRAGDAGVSFRFVKM